MSARPLGRALGALEAIAAGTWVGASAGFAFVSAPLAFHEVTDLDVFATLTERSLGRLARLTYVCEGAGIAASLARAVIDGSLASGTVSALAGAGAIACVAYQQRTIVPAMAQMQRGMGGSFAGVAPDDPRRIAYDAMHDRSTRVFGGALLLGLLQLALAATRAPAPAAPAAGSPQSAPDDTPHPPADAPPSSSA